MAELGFGVLGVDEAEAGRMSNDGPCDNVGAAVAAPCVARDGPPAFMPALGRLYLCRWPRVGLDEACCAEGCAEAGVDMTCDIAVSKTCGLVIYSFY